MLTIESVMKEKLARNRSRNYPRDFWDCEILRIGIEEWMEQEESIISYQLGEGGRLR